MAEKILLRMQYLHSGRGGKVGSSEWWPWWWRMSLWQQNQGIVNYELNKLWVANDVCIYDNKAHHFDWVWMTYCGKCKAWDCTPNGHTSHHCSPYLLSSQSIAVKLVEFSMSSCFVPCLQIQTLFLFLFGFIKIFLCACYHEVPTRFSLLSLSFCHSVIDQQYLPDYLLDAFCSCNQGYFCSLLCPARPQLPSKFIYALICNQAIESFVMPTAFIISLKVDITPRMSLFLFTILALPLAFIHSSLISSSI